MSPSYFRRSQPDRELYEAMARAERAAQEAHNLCYRDGGHGASPWLAMALGKAQAILMRNVARFANGRRPVTLDGRDDLRRAITEHRTAIHNAGPIRVDSRDVPIADAKQKADERLWSVLR